MEDEENISIENLDQAEVLEQQIQTYIIQIMNEDVTKQEKIQHLHRIALIYEREEEKYKKLLMDPNLDKRYDHTIGRLINLFIENEEFVLQITDKWMRENDVDIHTAIARLLFAVSISSDRSFFVTNPEEDEERLMEKFQFWIRTPPNKALRVYGTGLMAHFIEESDLAGNTLSTDLPVVALQRLNNYMSYMCSFKPENDTQLEADIEGTALQVPSEDDEVDANEPVLNELHVSNAALNELEQICLLKYIADVGEFQEVLAPIIQHRGVDILLYYLKSRDPYVVGASLKAINQLLAHRKFGSVFVDAGGMKALIDIPKNEFYAALVSHCMGSIAGLPQAIEQICLLQEPLPQQLIEYIVWLVNNPNEVPKKDGSLFFTLTMRFRKIFELFTASEMPRQMIEYMKEILNKLTFSQSPDEIMELGDDENTLTRSEMQIVGSFLLTLREYMRAQLVYQTELWKRKNAQAHNKDTTPRKSKPVPVTPSYKPLKVEDETVNETIVTVRDGNLAKAKFKEVEEFINLEGLIQTLKVVEHNNNLGERDLHTALAVDNATVALDVLHVLSATNYGQNELMNAKVGEKSAVSILLDAVRELQYDNPTVITVALKVLSNFVLKLSTPNINKQNKRQSIDPKLDELTKQTCKTIRLNDGISVLLSLLKYRTSIPDADTIRALACKVLTGLCKDTTIKQILNKKVTRTLPELIKEPVDRSNIEAFQKFKANAKELIQAITGREASAALDADHALTKYEQAAIVAQTPIHYSDNELLHLIYQHLTERGLEHTANALLSEAKIPAPPKQKSARRSRRSLATPSKRTQMMEVEGVNETSDEDSGEHLNHHNQNRLDVIMKEYLMDQHRKCGHPCAVLPDFSLMNRHRCPEPIDSVHTGRAAKNIGTRILHRQWRPVRGGYGGTKLDRRFKYSKYRPTRKVFDDGEMMTCCAVVDNGERLLIGTPNGEVLEYDARTTQVVKLWEHVSETSVHSLKTVRDQNIVMSFSLSPNETKVFNTSNLENPLYTLPTLSGEFNNAGDRIVGVKAPGKVAVYDVKTGQELISLDDTSYNRTLAPSFPCFSPDDSLLLSSGVLWDYRHQRPIYRFDRFSNYGAEKFNPSGLDIIINSEIWDTRSFKLVKTCSALDQTSIVFSNKGDVIFAVPRPPVLSFENPFANFAKTLRVVDATDYEIITELNHDKEIIDLTIDQEDSMLAMIESSGSNFEVHSMCRIWEIGRTRGVDDEDEWDEEDGEDEDDEDGEDDFDDMDLDDSEDAVEFFGDEDGEDDDLEGFLDEEDFDDDENVDIGDD